MFTTDWLEIAQKFVVSGSSVSRVTVEIFHIEIIELFSFNC